MKKIISMSEYHKTAEQLVRSQSMLNCSVTGTAIMENRLVIKMLQFRHAHSEFNSAVEYFSKVKVTHTPSFIQISTILLISLLSCWNLIFNLSLKNF